MDNLQDYLTVRGLFSDALAEGTRRSLMSIDWDISQDCEQPVTRVHFARPYSPTNSRELIVKTGSTPIPLQVSMEVRCRKCPKCRRFRQRQWAARSIAEYRSSARTWLGTLTFKPEEHDRILNLCQAEFRGSGQDFEHLSADEQFQKRHIRCSKLLTLWLGRVRKNSGVRFRYLLVLEAHKSGLPHYHALVHEPVENLEVTKRVLQAAWPHGFSNFKLIEADQSSGATYACKYLSKSNRARVRASVRYGEASNSPGKKQTLPPVGWLQRLREGD